MSALTKLASLLGFFNQGTESVPLSNRNLIIDGRFEFWTAGSGSATGGYGPLQMYYTYAGVGGAATVSQILLRGVTAGLDSNPIVGVKFAQTTVSTGTVAAFNTPTIAQHIEWVGLTAGRSVTLSCKMWTDSGTLNIPGISYSQNFGTGGSPTAQLNFLTTTNWNVTTTPKRFSVRIDCAKLPSGFTMGSNGNDWTAFGIMFPAGVTFSVNMAELQVEYCSANSSGDITGNGGNPTSYEYRGWQPEAYRVCRYYYATGGSQFNLYGYSITAGTAFYTTFTLPVLMRAIPAVNASWGSGVNANAGTFRMADARVGESFITSGTAGGCSAVVTWYTFDARL